jgi:hypothetical protein
MKILNALKMFSYEYYTYPPCVYRLDNSGTHRVPLVTMTIVAPVVFLLLLWQ